MLVQRVAQAGSRVESWTVLGEDDRPVEAIERYLGYLTAIERSPNTVKAYAHDLKDFFVFLTLRSLDWREVRLEDVGEFVAWLRLPPAGRTGKVLVLPSVDAQVGAATVNRKLSAVSSFYQHQARHGVGVGELLVVWKPGGRGGWKPFLHHISKDLPQSRRAISLRTPRKLPRVLTATETQAILDGCTRLRDRLLFGLLHDTGMRIGEALGLRHEDLAAAEREVTIVPRVNDNGARSKSGRARTTPVSADLGLVPRSRARQRPPLWSGAPRVAPDPPKRANAAERSSRGSPVGHKRCSYCPADLSHIRSLAMCAVMERASSSLPCLLYLSLKVSAR